MKIQNVFIVTVMSGELHFDFNQPIPSIPSISTSVKPTVVDTFIPTNIETQSRLENYEVNFKFNDEGYTLVNILKHYLEQMPEVLFVGRRQHNKVDDEMNLRIKLNSKWVRKYHQTVEQAMIDCLRRAVRQAINDTLSLRNSIPDVDQRVVDYDEDVNNIGTAQPDTNIPKMQILFDTSEFTF